MLWLSIPSNPWKNGLPATQTPCRHSRAGAKGDFALLQSDSVCIALASVTTRVLQAASLRPTSRLAQTGSCFFPLGSHHQLPAAIQTTTISEEKGFWFKQAFHPSACSLSPESVQTQMLIQLRHAFARSGLFPPVFGMSQTDAFPVVLDLLSLGAPLLPRGLCQPGALQSKSLACTLGVHKPQKP